MKYTKSLHILITEKQQKELRRVAYKTGKSVGAIVRECLVNQFAIEYPGLNDGRGIYDN